MNIAELWARKKDSFLFMKAKAVLQLPLHRLPKGFN
jgi:hypothetical protein